MDHPEQLVLLRNIDKDGMTDGFTLLECHRFREQKQAIQDVVALQDPDRDTVKIEGHRETAIRQRVSANFFTALGVKSAAGRTFAPGDAPTVVISYARGDIIRSPSLPQGNDTIDLDEADTGPSGRCCRYARSQPTERDERPFRAR
ncbi:MAG TPA: hypothetical protein VNY05_43950 [Candidatus Acidoferrales bacterium]|nr:hypothetical protein [Candidatus Acidoferrales bacterium]